MNKDYILITGGAGFIGSHLAQLLLGRGKNIIILDNVDDFYDTQIKEQNINLISDLGGIIIKGDIRDTQILEKIFFDYSIQLVVHLAAKAGVRLSLEEPISYFDVNVNGTINVLEIMKKHNCKKIIFASSSSVYGTNNIPFKESNVTDSLISPYAASKKSAEVILYTYYHLYQIDSIILRFFTVYGPRQRPDLAIHKFFKSLYMQKPIDFYGDGLTMRDYTYIDDIVSGIYNSINYILEENAIHEIINLGSQNPVTLEELIFTIQKVTGKKFIINQLPLQEGDLEQTSACLEKSKKLLDYHPKTGLETGLINFKVWFENYYNCK